MGTRTFYVWIHVFEAPDLPGVWMAHGLDLDVVTQGSSPRHALEMAREACEMVIEDDLAAGKEPTERWAPAKYWQVLNRIVNEGEPIEQLPADGGNATSGMRLHFAQQIVLHVPHAAPSAGQSAERPAPRLRPMSHEQRASSPPSC